MIVIEDRGEVACPEVLPAHHKECVVVERSKTGEGVVDLIRMIGGIFEIGMSSNLSQVCRRS